MKRYCPKRQQATAKKCFECGGLGHIAKDCRQGNFPLNNLMQKGMPFLWSSDCEQAFLSLKEKLIQAPVLAYPKLGANASTFTLEIKQML